MKKDVRGRPPLPARRLLKLLSRYQEDYAIAGDVEEVYNTILREEGKLKAAAWFWYQCLSAGALYGYHKLKWRFFMWKNYLRLSFRSYLRTPVLTGINLTGLAIGVGAFILIVLFYGYETSYDSFHGDSDHIYRISYNTYRSGDLVSRSAAAVPAIGPALKSNFSEVSDFARITRQFLEYAAFSSGNHIVFRENRVFLATPSFLRVFDFTLIKGDPESALSGPLKCVLTESTSQKYFGNEDPIGQVLTYNGRDSYEVTGICRDVQPNSHIKFDMLLSYGSLPYTAPIGSDGEEGETDWNWEGFYTYVVLKPGTDPKVFEAKIDDWVRKERDEDWKKRTLRQEFSLQQLEDIHLNSRLADEIVPEEQGDDEAVRILKLVAVFILVLAWVNYVNISTARNIERAKEVGIRKLAGADRRELVRQFSVEYSGIIFAALTLAVLFVFTIKPYFTSLTGAPFSFRYVISSGFWLELTAWFLLGTFLAGLYPSLLLSASNPVTVLTGKLTSSFSGIRMRKFLIVIQLAILVGLVAGSVIIFRQVSYLIHKDPGIDMAGVLGVHAPGMNEAPPETWSNNIDSFREEMSQYPMVKSMTSATSLPGKEILWENSIRKWEDHPSRAFLIKLVGIDANFIPTFGIEMIAGRNFSPALSSDGRSLVLNRAAVKALEFSSPDEALNQKIAIRGREWTIIGIMGDYHQQSVFVEPFPLAFRYHPNIGFLALKLSDSPLPRALNEVKSVWKRHFPGIPFDYFFLDESFNRAFQNQQKFSRIFALFTGLTFLIAGMGLLALSSLNASRRIKEIGIRKSMGASTVSIYIMLAKEFLRLALIAGLISIPVTFYYLNKWLAGFAYRIRVDWLIFAFSAGAVIILVLGAVSFQSYRAAAAEPVNALRYE